MKKRTANLETNEEREAILRFLEKKAQEASKHHRESLGDPTESGLWSFARGMLDAVTEAIEHGDHLSPKVPKVPMEKDAVHSREELEAMIDEMRETTAMFYGRAIRTNVHPFIEFTGFMNEFVKICEQALHLGIDFTQRTEHSGKPLPLLGHHGRYIGEKFACIFGPALRANKVALNAFLGKVHGHDH